MLRLRSKLLNSATEAAVSAVKAASPAFRRDKTEHNSLTSLGIFKENYGLHLGNRIFRTNGEVTPVVNPSTGEAIASVKFASVEDYKEGVGRLSQRRRTWANTPMPVRGEVVRKIAAALRRDKEKLAEIICLEMGKIKQEALGEVQEAIDICDYAVGLSRSIGGGPVLPSERPDHFMMEKWHPLTGNVSIITAFNFPLAVFFWNAALSLVCGNTMVFKPAPSTPLIGLAASNLINRVLRECEEVPIISMTVVGGADVGQAIVEDPRSALVSFTGSTAVGRKVAQTVASRFGKHILELGGNNAVFVMPDADIDMAVKSCVFGAVGTTGQRCTSLRRLYVHAAIYEQFRDKLVEAYKTLTIGDPLDPKVMVGPMHSQDSVNKFLEAVEKIKSRGGNILIGGTRIDRPGFFVEPAVAEVHERDPALEHELFGPLLHLVRFTGHIRKAISLNNKVQHGLSSSIFTRDLSTAMIWTSATGSDCGIANVNIGPSGAEIGGAFGGEKATGGGRESGSDAWKQYMRRQTITMNYGKSLPLAQGIVFGAPEAAVAAVEEETTEAAKKEFD